MAFLLEMLFSSPWQLIRSVSPFSRNADDNTLSSSLGAILSIFSKTSLLSSCLRAALKSCFCQRRRCLSTLGLLVESNFFELLLLNFFSFESFARVRHEAKEWISSLLSLGFLPLSHSCGMKSRLRTMIVPKIRRESYPKLALFRSHFC